MSCFPKHRQYSDAADLKVFNQICFQAGFAHRESKNMPSISKVPKDLPKYDKSATTDLPRFMQPSKAHRKRNEETLRKREMQNIKRAKEIELGIMKQQNAHAKQNKINEGKAFQSRLKVNIEKYEDEKFASDQKKATNLQKEKELPSSPIKTRREMQKTQFLNASGSSGEEEIKAAIEVTNERFSPIKSRSSSKQQTINVNVNSVAHAMDKQLNEGKISNLDPVEEEKVTTPSGSAKVHDGPKIVRPTDMASKAAAPVPGRATKATKLERMGGGESFNYSDNAIFIPKLAAKRCWRILTYANTKNGRQVMDVAEGNLYWCRTGPQKRRITPNAVAFDTKELALSERFPSTQVGSAVSGNGTLPRVLVSFDCWGKATRRTGGGGSAKYEYCKFIRIEQFLNSPTSGAKKTCETPTAPNYYPVSDPGILKSRLPIDNSIYIDKRFDTTPWKKVSKVPVSARTKDLMSSINNSRPSVPSSKVGVAKPKVKIEKLF
jgi:hypothetical protein